jgi:hypothetical protein
MLIDVLTLLTSLLLSWNHAAVDAPGCAAYFPSPPIDSFRATWFCEQLRAMGESPLLEVTPAGSRSFRLTVLPTWGNAVTVRLMVSGKTGRVEGRRLQNQAGYGVGPLAEVATSELRAAELRALAGTFERQNVSGMAPVEEIDGADGDEWILEFVEAGRWHVIEQWTPSGDTKTRGLTGFLDFCTQLYRLGPLRGDVLNKGTTILSKEP